MPSLVSATWSAWRAANLPPPGTFAERDFASAIVKLGVRVPRSARTAGSLGAEREGTGVVIDDQDTQSVQHLRVNCGVVVLFLTRRDSKSC